MSKSAIPPTNLCVALKRACVMGTPSIDSVLKEIEHWANLNQVKAVQIDIAPSEWPKVEQAIQALKAKRDIPETRLFEHLSHENRLAG